MTDSAFRGPISNMGSLEDSPATVQTEDGPLVTYQGVVVPNLRGGIFNKDGVGAGRVPGFVFNNSFVLVDNIPSTATTTILATAAVVTSGSAMTLVTIAPGNTTAGTPSVATGVPIVPFGSATATTAAIALDFGFTTGTTVASSSTVAVVDNTLFTQGQWITIGGAGNSAKTAALLTQVVAISTSNTTTINIFPLASGALTNAPIGAANLFNAFLPPATQFGPGTSVPNAHSISLAAGLARPINPSEMITRTVSITATTTSAAGGAFIVSGWDIYNQPMTEKITVAAATTTSAYGKKAFKYIGSVIPQFTDAAGTYSVGVSDVFGMNMRADKGEYVEWCWNGLVKVSNTGFIAAVTTSPANNTTGDVRGTIQASTIGGGTAITGNSVSNGTSRLFVFQTQPLWNQITGTPNNTVPFFGVTQA